MYRQLEALHSYRSLELVESHGGVQTENSLFYNL